MSISRDLTRDVQLHRRYYDKGPTGAKTYAVNDTIVCLLSGGFTTVEQTLIDDGKADEVENIRRSFQKTIRDHFTGVVERATGRRVIAYLARSTAAPTWPPSCSCSSRPRPRCSASTKSSWRPTSRLADRLTDLVKA